jgi:hypothetical protein
MDSNLSVLFIANITCYNSESNFSVGRSVGQQGSLRGALPALHLDPGDVGRGSGLSEEGSGDRTMRPASQAELLD